MSCDHAIWYPSELLTDAKAGALYIRLCEGDLSGVTPHRSVDDFYAELTATHPEIDTIAEERIGDFAYCPWSVAFDRSPGHLIICCVWSKADYVGSLLRELAEKHGLALYDPQSEQVHFPSKNRPPQTTKRWKLW
jgi:hypothetical protein